MTARARAAALTGLGIAWTLTLPARALTTVCTATWASSVNPGDIATGTIGAGSSPCPATPITVTATVGTGSNAGTADGATNWGSFSGSSDYPTSSNTSIYIGVPTDVYNNSQPRTFTFSEAVTNPYVYVSYVDIGSSYIFSDAFTVLQINKAVRNGQEMTSAPDPGGSDNTANSGFVLQMQKTYGPGNDLTFFYRNAVPVNSVAMTVGITAPAETVPAPLPLLGAAAAFRLSRRLRCRLIKASAGSAQPASTALRPSL